MGAVQVMEEVIEIITTAMLLGFSMLTVMNLSVYAVLKAVKLLKL